MADSISQYAKNFSNPFQNLGVELHGEWVKYERLMAYLTDNRSSRIKSDIASGQKSFLELFKRTLLGALASEGASVGAPFAPHSPGYYSPTGMIGIRSTKYLQALANLRITQKSYNVSLGFAAGAMNQKSRPRGARMALYALWFEEGNMNQPARPFWNPTFLAIGGSQTAHQYLTKAISMRLNSLGI